MRKIPFLAFDGDISGSAQPADVAIGVLCLMNMGNTAYMKAAPVLPQQQKSEFEEGKLFKWGKIAFEKYFLWKIGSGYTGLR